MDVFTRNEIKDILISVAALTLIFAWKPFPKFGLDIGLLPTFAVIVVVAFVFHELAHKFTARRFGLVAHYKMWPQGILFGFVFMILGLKFVAPGAVQIYPYRFGRWGHRRARVQFAEMGITAGAGPAINIILAIVFSLFEGNIFHSLTFINAWLALFNLLPFPPLDGSKVLTWKPWIWAMMFGLALILVLVTVL